MKDLYRVSPGNRIGDLVFKNVGNRHRMALDFVRPDRAPPKHVYPRSRLDTPPISYAQLKETHTERKQGLTSF